jgi:serine/threonine-protein kinase
VESESTLALLPKGKMWEGRYEIGRCLRSGGMGAIYEVVDTTTRRRRALKVMLPSVVASAEMQARFRLEATVAADIESDHIVEVFDAGIDSESGAPFLVMELLRGEDLQALLDDRKRLPAEEVIPILAQAASALDKTHAAGVVHRDLKPDNLFLAQRDDGSPKLKILDFGIAKVVAESGQAAPKTRILGTPMYMSPEQIRGDGDIGPRADLYALGHIAFTLLVGRGYWSENAADDQVYALMTKIVAGAPEPASTRAERLGGELPARFDEWFTRATAVDSSDRHASATELVESLAQVFEIPFVRPPTPATTRSSGATRALSNPVRSLTPTATAGPSREHEPTSGRSRGIILALIAVAVVAAIVGARLMARPAPAAVADMAKSSLAKAPSAPASPPPLSPAPSASAVPALPAPSTTARVTRAPRKAVSTPPSASVTAPKRTLD